MSSTDTSTSNVLATLKKINPKWNLSNFPSHQVICEALSAKDLAEFKFDTNQQLLAEFLSKPIDEISQLNLNDMLHHLQHEDAEVRICFLLALNYPNRFPNYDKFLGSNPSFNEVMKFLGVNITAETTPELLGRELSEIQKNAKFQHPSASNLANAITPFINIVLFNYKAEEFNQAFFKHHYKFADPITKQLLLRVQEEYFSNIFFDADLEDVPDLFPKTTAAVKNAAESASSAASSLWLSTTNFFSGITTSCMPSSKASEHTP